jgi:2'-5' RNA ligase
VSAVAGGRTTGAERALRLFFALLPDAPARRALARLAVAVARETGGRATPPGNLHLTLAFLGSVPRERLANVEAIGAQAAAAAAPFRLTLDRLGAFRDARVAWIEPTAEVPALAGIAAALADRMSATGLPVERVTFRPHLTLARHVARSPGASGATAAWRVEDLALMASDTRPAGAVYRVIAAWPLGGRESAGVRR